MSDTACRLCKEASYEFGPDIGVDASGICARCREKLGVVPIPPSRRPPVPCTRCNGMQFVRAIPREYTAYSDDNGTSSYVAPMCTTTLPDVRARRIFDGNVVNSMPTLQGGRGMLEMYICTGCGFVEWYCQDPQSIPVGVEFMTELVNYAPPSPYR